MSVYTAADELRDSAKEDIKNAIDKLHKILVEGCWGSDDYSKEYEQKLWKMYRKLIKAHQIL